VPAPLQRFRAYEIAEDPAGGSLELWRTDREVVCLASLPTELRWVELHVIAGVDTQDPAARVAVDDFRAHVHALMRVRDRRSLEILEAGEDEGALFYVSEYIDGESLDRYLARLTPLPAWWAVEIARQLTMGLVSLRAQPALLSRVQIFNARLTLEGEAAGAALVKLADFDLGGPAAAAPLVPAAVESRAVVEVGRLFCYALSGLVAEQITPHQLAALPVPPEVIDLLGRLLHRPGRTALHDLSSLLAALSACAVSPALAAAPARIPPALRPRLPLAAHFPTLPQVAAEIGDRLRLERATFDAAHPYVQRAFAGTTPVTVQLLPPARLIAPHFLPTLREVAGRAAKHPHPHLLRPLEIPSIDDPGWFLEEGPPRLTLEGVRQLRPALIPAEAAFLLRAHAQAVEALETAGFSPVAISPEDSFIDFSGSGEPTPGDDQLASQPVHTWPPFIIKFRAHPTAVHIAQPQRFLRERLVASRSPRSSTDRTPGPPAGLGPPSTADLAAIFVWLCDGMTGLPAALARTLTSTLEGEQAIDRATLIEALTPLIPRTTPSNARSPAASPPPPPPGRPSKNKGRRGKKKSHPASPTPVPGDRPAVSPATARSDTTPAAAPAAVLPPPASVLDESAPHFAGWQNDDPLAAESAEAGFAEILLGSPPDSTIYPETAGTPDLGWLPPASTTPEATEDMPVGAMFGRWAPPDDDDTFPDSAETRQLDFSSRSTLDRGPGFGRLVVLVVLVALIIAVLMAHFTGLAPWL
jgi:hypothetical protein